MIGYLCHLLRDFLLLSTLFYISNLVFPCLYIFLSLFYLWLLFPPFCVTFRLSLLLSHLSVLLCTVSITFLVAVDSTASTFVKLWENQLHLIDCCISQASLRFFTFFTHIFTITCNLVHLSKLGKISWLWLTFTYTCISWIFALSFCAFLHLPLDHSLSPLQPIQSMNTECLCTISYFIVAVNSVYNIFVTLQEKLTVVDPWCFVSFWVRFSSLFYHSPAMFPIFSSFSPVHFPCAFSVLFSLHCQSNPLGRIDSGLLLGSPLFVSEDQHPSPLSTRCYQFFTIHLAWYFSICSYMLCIFLCFPMPLFYPYCHHHINWWRLTAACYWDLHCLLVRINVLSTFPYGATKFSPSLTLKVLNFWKVTSYCNLKPLWSGMGEVVLARTLPTLHPPSPPTVHQLLRLAL